MKQYHKEAPSTGKIAYFAVITQEQDFELPQKVPEIETDIEGRVSPGRLLNSTRSYPKIRRTDHRRWMIVASKQASPWTFYFPFFNWTTFSYIYHGKNKVFVLET